MTDELSSDLLLPGLGDSSNTTEVKTEEVDPKAKFRDKYKELLDAAHESLGDQNISDLGLDHKYWRLMNEARTYAHVKGL